MWSCPLQVGLHSDVRQTSAVSTGTGIRILTQWYLRSSGSIKNCSSLSVNYLSSCLWHLRFLCCTCEVDLWDWITCFLRAQVRVCVRSDHTTVTLLLRFCPGSLPEWWSGSSSSPPSLILRHLQAEVWHHAFGSDQRRWEQQQHVVSQSDAGQYNHNDARTSLKIHNDFFVSSAEEATWQKDSLHVLCEY